MNEIKITPDGKSIKPDHVVLDGSMKLEMLVQYDPIIDRVFRKIQKLISDGDYVLDYVLAWLRSSHTVIAVKKEKLIEMLIDTK